MKKAEFSLSVGNEFIISGMVDFIRGKTSNQNYQEAFDMGEYLWGKIQELEITFSPVFSQYLNTSPIFTRYSRAEVLELSPAKQKYLNILSAKIGDKNKFEIGVDKFIDLVKLRCKELPRKEKMKEIRRILGDGFLDISIATRNGVDGQPILVFSRA